LTNLFRERFDIARGLELEEKEIEFLEKF